ncbi:MAG TPA: hypothetical protein VNB22_16515 [Pyrinomonadaceae bacterium]|nr:hypothetical protein [Pyrinomonadaceae bacterium]
MSKILLRGFAVWLAIIAAEFLHGTLRVLFLQPFVGDFRARQISVFTGILIILTISYLCAGWLRAENSLQLFLVGLLWLVLTVAFEISLGRLLNLSWERIFSDYDLRNGGLMPIGLLFLIFAPLIAAKLKRKF